MRNNVLSLLKSARVTFTSSQLLVESVPGWQEKKDYPVKLMTDAERKLRIYSNVKNWTKESEHQQTKKKIRSSFCSCGQNLSQIPTTPLSGQLVLTHTKRT